MATDNSGLRQKIDIRRWLMGRISPPHRVLDLYCGSAGEMYRGCWSAADLYLGVDKRTPHALGRTIRLSAEEAVEAIDLDLFNIYDLDPYDSPWIVARRIIHRRGPGVFGMALTSGECHGMMSGRSNEVVRAILGIRNLSDTRLFGRYWHDVFHLLCKSLGEINGTRIISPIAVASSKPKSGAYWVSYAGIVLDKPSEACYNDNKKAQSTGREHHAGDVVRNSGGDSVRGHDDL